MVDIKCVIVGDCDTGKTCIIQSYCNQNLLIFEQEYIPTVFDWYKTNNFKLWDMAGDASLHSLRYLSYPKTDIILLTFSVINKASYLNVKNKWFTELKKYTPNSPIILIGTKTNKRSLYQNSITKDQGLLLQKDINAIKYFECSSFSLQEVNDVFIYAFQIINNQPKNYYCCII